VTVSERRSIISISGACSVHCWAANNLFPIIMPDAEWVRDHDFVMRAVAAMDTIIRRKRLSAMLQ
jgi:hypothetical protein